MPSQGPRPRIGQGAQRVADREGQRLADHLLAGRAVADHDDALDQLADKVVINLEMYGNTTAGTIPLALADANVEMPVVPALGAAAVGHFELLVPAARATRNRKVGVIATEKGWNLFVGGNGGTTPPAGKTFTSSTRYTIIPTSASSSAHGWKPLPAIPMA